MRLFESFWIAPKGPPFNFFLQPAGVSQSPKGPPFSILSLRYGADFGRSRLVEPYIWRRRMSFPAFFTIIPKQKGHCPQRVLPSICLIFCNRMNVKKFQMVPYRFFGTMGLLKFLIFSKLFLRLRRVPFIFLKFCNRMDVKKSQMPLLQFSAL